MDEVNAPIDTTQQATPQVQQPASQVQQPVAPQVAQPTPQVQQPTEVQPGDNQQPTQSNPA